MQLLVCTLKYMYAQHPHMCTRCCQTWFLQLSYRLSFIMVKRMCAGHSDSFTCAATELGSTLLVFLAIENISKTFFFKQNLSDSLGGAVDVGWVMLCIVFNLLSHYMLYWTYFPLHSAGLLCSLILSMTLWSFLWIISILFYSILF